MDQDLKHRDKWPYHYRGTRYHFSSEQVVWWQTFKNGLEIRVKSGYDSIIKELIKIRPEGGSFRITETGDVIIKMPDDGSWTPVYVCEMDQPFEFSDDIDITPAGIKPGDIWPGFYDGARYSYLNDKVWWMNPEGPRQYIVETLPPEVMTQLRILKSMGGSFRITENGCVITLIPKQPLPNELRRQWESMSVTQQQLITAKVEATEMLPIYIGRYHEGVSLQEPKDFTKPLSAEERKKMLDFLNRFSVSGEFEGMVPKDAEDEGEDEEFFDDPED